jgi:hypothetical protein
MPSPAFAAISGGFRSGKGRERGGDGSADKRGHRAAEQNDDRPLKRVEPRFEYLESPFHIPAKFSDLGVDAIEAPIDLPETPIDFLKAPIDLLEALINLGEAVVDALRQLVETLFRADLGHRLHE